MKQVRKLIQLEINTLPLSVYLSNLSIYVSIYLSIYIFCQVICKLHAFSELPPQGEGGSARCGVRMGTGLRGQQEKGRSASEFIFT